MFGVGLIEVIIVVIALGVLFFGENKTTEIARSLGKFTGEFKKSRKEIEKEIIGGKKEISEGIEEVEKEMEEMKELKKSITATKKRRVG
ncbi:MAG: twin-arginine translocase TatA/TatE family subunit [Candidatus Pacebacteria bacterium]|nr:twin-arginine translocase TatA/TatE family subunit [Candidatus Paceibacterota bacterium]